MKYLTVIPLIMVLAISVPKAKSKPIVIRGNENGIWTTSHPEMMRSTPIFSAQDVAWRSPEPLSPLPPLTEFYYEEPISLP
jgi:hypothetical protein